MHVQIGAGHESGFDDPLGLLRDCHRRIESFLDALVRVAASDEARLDEGRRRALGAALTYFRDAAPKHTADEEESLFPRLRALGREDVRPLLDAAARLEREHALADALHERVERIGRAWLDAGEIGRDELASLRSDLDALKRLYAAHIALEDDHVFPAAAHALDSAALGVIGREMAARRGLGRSRAGEPG